MQTLLVLGKSRVYTYVPQFLHSLSIFTRGLYNTEHLNGGLLFQISRAVFETSSISNFTVFRIPFVYLNVATIIQLHAKVISALHSTHGGWELDEIKN